MQVPQELANLDSLAWVSLAGNPVCPVPTGPTPPMDTLDTLQVTTMMEAYSGCKSFTVNCHWLHSEIIWKSKALQSNLVKSAVGFVMQWVKLLSARHAEMAMI